ncbi:glycosyltransferase family 4 protein [Tsukamurella soli]|uniref:Glycosyltransferase family 4 protein n=1 Tax=Tsukamurella soli TaxID=644556 RepID=A0ABP8K6G1_9ACTN
MREVLLLCWRDTGHPQGGGSERYLERVGAELARAGVTVTLRTAAYPGAPREEIRDGVRISRGGGRFTVYPRALAALALSRVGLGPLRGMRPDAVIDTQNGIPFFARLATTAPVTVLVHHCHREQWPVAGRLTARVGWFIESRLSPRVHRGDQYLTVSLPSAEELEALGVDGDRIAVVRNGADPLPPHVAPGGSETRCAAPRLVVLSRLVPHKQIEDALEVLARLRGSHSGLHLDVVGGGWWDEPLRDRAAELGIAGHVTFHGHVSEQRKHEILARAWVHVMPSRKEGWGITVVEAGQHGVPTVGYSASRGLTDSVVDGVTGVLVSSRDGLVDAVDALLADPERRADLGEKARARAAEFSWAETGSGVARVLDAVVAGRRVGGLVPSGS